MSDVTQIPAGTYTIDASHSEVGFTARHAMVTKVRGAFSDVEGTVTVGEGFTGSSARATIGVDSVDTRSAVILNPASFTHYSYGLRDAAAPTHGGRVLSYVYDSGLAELDDLGRHAANAVSSPGTTCASTCPAR